MVGLPGQYTVRPGRRSISEMFTLLAVVGFVVVFWYLSAAVLVFRFRNPTATETQLFLHIPDACCWRKLDRFQEHP